MLRLSPGKDHADIYDFITLPRSVAEAAEVADEDARLDLGLVRRECERMRDFMKLARDSFDSWQLLQEITDAYRLDADGEDADFWEDEDI